MELALEYTSDHPILIVDDDPSFLSIVTAFMVKAGWRFEVAIAGKQAIARLAEDSFAAVLLDLNLPDISGLDVLRAITDLPNAPPVVFISGDASVQSALEAGRFGAVDFIEKPVTMSSLLATLAASIQRRSGRVLTTTGADRPSVLPVVARRFSRLSEVVVRASLSPDDFRNGRGLAKAGNVGYGTLRRWCHAADVDGRRLVRFARGFWAVRRGLELRCPPADRLDVVDPRSTAAILDPRLVIGTTLAAYCAVQRHLEPGSPIVAGCLATLSG